MVLFSPAKIQTFFDVCKYWNTKIQQPIANKSEFFSKKYVLMPTDELTFRLIGKEAAVV